MRNSSSCAQFQWSWVPMRHCSKFLQGLCSPQHLTSSCFAVLLFLFQLVGPKGWSLITLHQCCSHLTIQSINTNLKSLGAVQKGKQCFFCDCCLHGFRHPLVAFHPFEWRIGTHQFGQRHEQMAAPSPHTMTAISHAHERAQLPSIPWRMKSLNHHCLLWLQHCPQFCESEAKAVHFCFLFTLFFFSGFVFVIGFLFCLMPFFLCFSCSPVPIHASPMQLMPPWN